MESALSIWTEKCQLFVGSAFFMSQHIRKMAGINENNKIMELLSAYIGLVEKTVGMVDI